MDMWKLCAAAAPCVRISANNFGFINLKFQQPGLKCLVSCWQGGRGALGREAEAVGDDDWDIVCTGRDHAI